MARTTIEPKQFFFFNKRIRILIGIIIGLFSILFLRITFLQVVEGKKYERYALENREEVVRIPTRRGEIYDRNYDPVKGTGELLASSEEKLGLYISPVYLTDEEVIKIIKKIEKILTIDLNEKIEEFKNRKEKYVPFLLVKGVSVRDIAKIAERINELPGVYWEPIYIRKYLKRDFASHVIGYIGSITKEELEKLSDDPEYHMHSEIGKMGVEKSYDKELRGKEGILIRIVDAQRRIKNTLKIKDPIPGDTLSLTIDYRIQSIVEKAMKRKKGAAVVIDPKTGEILALVSKPSFDPNIFTDKKKKKKFFKLMKAEDKPFLNRVIQAHYPPGSVFKIVTSTAALEEEAISPYDRFYCKGYFRFENDNRVFHCTGIHGSVDLLKGIQYSCNVYFFNVSYILGSKRILKYARYYGFGEKAGIDIPYENSGFLPTHRWKKRVFGEPWYDGDTINLGIGQGFLLTTVLQIADMMCAIANGGVIYKPHVVKAIYSPLDGSKKYEARPSLIKNVPISKRTLKFIREGLRRVVTGGTARIAGRFAKTSVAGKTSTAQNITGEPHAWFACYAPYTTDKNRIVVVVFIENGGGGGEVAAPVAIGIINAIFKGDDPVKVEKRIRYAIEKYRQLRLMQKKEMETMEEQLD